MAVRAATRLAQVLAMAGLVLPPLASAEIPVVIDVEGLVAMGYVSRQPIPPEARLSDQMLAVHGVLFSSGAPYVAVVNLGLGHATSGVNGMGGSTPEGILTYASTNPVVFRFFDLGNPQVPGVTDFVSVRGDMIGHGQPIVNAYDLNGVLVDSDRVVDSGGAVLTVAGSGIHRVEFLGTQDDGGVALDDVTFNPVATPPTAAASTTWGKVKALYR